MLSFHQLWISEDFGGEWRVIERYVKTYYWSEMTSPPTLYIVREEPTGGATVLSSQMLFRYDVSEVVTIACSPSSVLVVKHSQVIPPLCVYHDCHKLW